MKIILNQDVENLGEEGSVCDVADGYGRNYLIPKKYAVPYTKQTVAMFESRKNLIEKRKQEKRESALGLVEKIEAEHLVIEMPTGENGKLFGSVTNAAIAEALEKKGITVEKKRIDIPDHTIKVIGEYNVTVKLYGQQTANLKLTVKSE